QKNRDLIFTHARAEIAGNCNNDPKSCLNINFSTGKKIDTLSLRNHPKYKEIVEKNEICTLTIKVTQQNKDIPGIVLSEDSGVDELEIESIPTIRKDELNSNNSIVNFKIKEVELEGVGTIIGFACVFISVPYIVSSEYQIKDLNRISGNHLSFYNAD